MASLRETCKLNAVDPYASLRTTLTAIANRPPASRIDDLRPWASKTSQAKTRTVLSHRLCFSNTVTVDTAAFSGGYGMRGAVETADGRILLPISDVPHYRSALIVESADGGQIWSTPRLVAPGDGHEFEEPAIVRGKGDRLILVLRDNVTRHLHQCITDNNGRSWSKPMPLLVSGYPAHLLRFADGRIILTYGWRQPGYNFRAVVSAEDGETWQMEYMVVIRDGMPNGNLGYSVTLERGDGVTAILATHWQIG